MSRLVELRWNGPYAWPTFEGELPAAPNHPGVYLFTFEYGDGYLVYAAGITRRGIRKRLREHTRSYLSGEYNILDVDGVKLGVRTEVWHGWGWTDRKRKTFDESKKDLQDAARRQLQAFRIFATETSAENRVRERVEATVMKTLAGACEPFCNIPDVGMHLEPRHDDEEPIVAINRCERILHALPPQFEI